MSKILFPPKSIQVSTWPRIGKHSLRSHLIFANCQPDQKQTLCRSTMESSPWVSHLSLPHRLRPSSRISWTLRTRMRHSKICVVSSTKIDYSGRRQLTEVYPYRSCLKQFHLCESILDRIAIWPWIQKEWRNKAKGIERFEFFHWFESDQNHDLSIWQPIKKFGPISKSHVRWWSNQTNKTLIWEGFNSGNRNIHPSRK
jgi:hypothetical protein